VLRDRPVDPAYWAAFQVTIGTPRAARVTAP
jgi:hypothetical protein